MRTVILLSGYLIAQAIRSLGNPPTMIDGHIETALGAVTVFCFFCDLIDFMYKPKK